MESPSYPESPMEDDMAFPCKGCGQILEEGKAFELAGNRWHIDCFRCNTCGTLLDSDANLLLLGDGSLICNNCTYSCSNCGNKIEDLAILTGDQAFCANCFKCRNCKRKIENLRYARTSQGIFCMDCHESLMARRRKKTARNAAQRTKSGGPHVKLDKSLPSLPPGDMPQQSLAPDFPTPQSESHSDTPTEVPQQSRPQMHSHHDSSNGIKRTESPSVPSTRDNLTLPANTFKNKRHSFMAQQADDGDADEFTIPLAFDPTPPVQQSPQINTSRPTVVNEQPRDYFNAAPSAKRAPGETPPSSHIAYQDKGRRSSGGAADHSSRREIAKMNVSSPPMSENLRPNYQGSPKVQHPARDSSEEKFKLQEVPKLKRAGGSSRNNSRTDAVIPPPDPQPATTNGIETPSVTKPKEPTGQPPSEPTKSSPMVNAKPATPRPSHESKVRENGSTDMSRSAQAAAQSPQPPKRTDSDSKPALTIPRKEVPGSVSRPTPTLSTLATTNESSASPLIPRGSEPSSPPRLSSGKAISSPIESPKAKSVFDTSSDNSKDPFAAPRAPPPAPPGLGHSKNESISTMQSDSGRHGEPHSPALPRWSAGGQFSMDEDMARIMGADGNNQESFLKRVSNSVRHGRSFSDKGMRLSREAKWPRSPVLESIGQDISSPNSALPEDRDELAWFKNELRRERQKNLARERKIAELEAMVNSTADIKQANTELREKRSTMVVLDAQKEIVVRELEVLTEHIADSKKTGEPFDLNKFTNTALRDFGETLQKLRDSFAPKIEEAIQTRQDLMAEIANLNQMKEKSFQEFEQLSNKNAQLAELNNTLVHQIQNLYKANSTKDEERGPPNGLGIYSHHKEKSSVSVDSKEIPPTLNDASLPGSHTAMQPEEAEPVTVLQGPQVVNIRKGGQAKKFNWKKGGQNVAKGVTKGLKGAFSSTQQSYAREMQFTETQPYGITPPGSEYSSLPKSSGSQQSNTMQKGFGFFGGVQKPGTRDAQPPRLPSNDSSSALAVDASTTLFGADLEQRAEFEKNPIPHIITRCIEEVEMRGMDAEGIYRKSGGNSQILIVKEGFEKDPQSFDISDPDLDIHAVTSGLKQYLRRLPTPLITYDVYDLLLDSMKQPTPEARVEAIQRAIIELPQVHQDVLEFLVFHLKRVVAREKENLMTPTNIAVVFAPTIMRPESITREMTDTAKKNETVQFIVEHCQDIFLGNH